MAVRPVQGQHEHGRRTGRGIWSRIAASTCASLYAWEFEKDGQSLRVRVDGQLTFNNSYAMVDAAVSGFGIAYVPDSMAAAALASGALEQVLDDWSPPFDGYFLYYPSRRQNLLAFQIVVDALRHRNV